MPENVTTFGHTPDGTRIDRIALTGQDLSAAILTYGATVQDLRLSGVPHPLVLGWESLDDYLTSSTYFGAIVGRFANRIGNGRYRIAEQEFRTQRNFLDQHTLHGGAEGSSHQVWRIENADTQSVELSLEMPDGHMGFSGHLDVRALYKIAGGNSLQVTLRARCQSPSLCNFAPHGYFNLDGSKNISGHNLQIDAASYLEVDDDLIPTGELLPTKGSAFDFNVERAIGGQEIDHNFCLAPTRRDIRKVASLFAPQSGVRMTVLTTEPGLQIYTAAQLDEPMRKGLGGRTYGNFAGIAIEPQVWPDAPNKPGFPNAVLYPDEVYEHITRFAFDRT